jgi:putative membrane protein
MADLQWWCSAQGTTWSWVWRPYPGVWLFVGLAATLYWWLARRGASASASPARAAAAVAAIVVLWLTLDWPVGALGAGYLASVHSVQFIALAMIVPPLLLLGVAPERWAALAERAGAMRVVQRVTQPLFTMLAFILVMLVTHAPLVVDGLMATQAGSFLLDMLWLGSGILFWWPVVAPVPARPRFGAPLQIPYLFFGTVAHVFLAMWLLLAEFPVYATYELAPPIRGMTAVADQQLAGGALLLIGTPLVMITISVIFFRWMGSEGEGQKRVTRTG